MKAIRAALPPRYHAAYTTRFVQEAIVAFPDEFWLDTNLGQAPESGDVVIARVDTIGSHKRIERPDSRKAILWPGSYVMVAYGDRYAVDQFHARIPESLRHCHLAAAGGVAGEVIEQHSRMAYGPTELTPIGLLHRGEKRANLRDFAAVQLDSEPIAREDRPLVVAVLGTSMNSGKSTTAASIVNGFFNAGRRAAAAKVTGTGAGNDRWLLSDAGAARVIDFTDFGYASTYRVSAPEILDLLIGSIRELTSVTPEIIVLEIADGVFEEETAALLRDPAFAEHVDAIVFTAGDALGAVGGVRAVQEAGRAVAAVSGLVTASPLGTREASLALSDYGVQVVPTADFTCPERAGLILAGLSRNT